MGDFGFFTDLTPTDNGLTPGLDAEIFVDGKELLMGRGYSSMRRKFIYSWRLQMVWDGLELGIMSMQHYISAFNFSEDHLTLALRYLMH